MVQGNEQSLSFQEVTHIFQKSKIQRHKKIKMTLTKLMTLTLLLDVMNQGLVKLLDRCF